MRTHNEAFRQPDEGPSSAGVEGDSSFDGHRLPGRHICEFCCKEFGSWKSWSKHCCVGDGGADGDDDDDSNGLPPPPPPLLIEEDQHLANCHVLLSNARGATDRAECSTAASFPIRITEVGECSTSERKDEIVDYVVVAPPLLPRPEAPSQFSAQTSPIARANYECMISCQKVFNSHQALGGRQASHMKVNGCFANQLEMKQAKIPKYTTTEDERNNQAGASSENMASTIVPFGETSSQLPLPKQKSKVHECIFCNRQFPSGQALGGNNRCHWSGSSSRGAATASTAIAAEPLSVVATELQVGNSSTEPLVFNSTIFSIDLNLPAPTDDFPEFTLGVDMPTAMYVEPERENATENVLNVNIEEAHSREEVRVIDLSELIDMNEREDGSKWLQIGFGSISDQENESDQP